YAISCDCAIRDLSESGAQMRLPSSQALPPTFALIHILEGAAFEAEVAWRRGDLAGVKFLQRHDLREAVPRDLLPLRNVWLALAPAEQSFGRPSDRHLSPELDHPPRRDAIEVGRVGRILHQEDEQLVLPQRHARLRRGHHRAPAEEEAGGHDVYL